MDCGKIKGKLLRAHSNNHLDRFLIYILTLNQEILCKALWQLGHHTLLLEQCVTGKTVSKLEKDLIKE